MKHLLLTKSGCKRKGGKLHTFIIIMFFFLLSFGLYAKDIKNPDKPAKGESTFDIKKVWTIDSAGKVPFGNISGILISDQGVICSYDSKNGKYFLFDEKGKFINVFGSRGEGPGEIKQPEEAPIFKAGDKIVVQDVDRLHYFSWEGKYLRSAANPSFIRIGSFFHFLCSPFRNIS